MGALLSLRGVSKSYWRGSHELTVLDQLSLDVHPAELVAVWGRRGAGKTTLLRIAAGLETVDGGIVCFEGVDLSTLSEHERARLMREGVGWVGRGGPAGDLTMLDYVALPLLIEHGRRRAHARASAALRRVGVHECAGQQWGGLSDGERALVGIAHGIARTPRLMLIDDPTANLGLVEREEVGALLRALVEETGVAVLMTVPDMPTAMRSHQLTALSGGRLLVPTPTANRRGEVIEFPGGERSPG